MKLFITGTGTNVGKTVLSSLIMSKYAKELDLKYLKLIQTGTSESDDTNSIIELTSMSKNYFLPPIYSFTFPASPHLAAKKENKEIEIDYLEKEIRNSLYQKLIIEGAGGIMVPITTNYLMIDLIKSVNFPVVVVGSAGLGTINHFLLTIEMLKMNNIKVIGFYMIGTSDDTTEDNIDIIESISKVPYLGLTEITEKFFNMENFRNYANTEFDKDEKVKEILL
jgi:dethiobiotin synthetase